MLSIRYLMAFWPLLMLQACNDFSYDKTDYDFEANEQVYSVSLSPVFDPENRLIPTTNNFFFVGSKAGTLNIPTGDLTGGAKALAETMNTLDGYGLSAPFSVDLTNKVNPASVVLGSSVYVLKVSMSGDTVTNITLLSRSELLVTTNAAQNGLVFIPLVPLAESTRYVVVLTNDLQDTEGKAASSPTAYLLTKGNTPLTGAFVGLEPFRTITNESETVAASAGIAKQRIILSWSFTTQSVMPVLDEVAKQASAISAGLVDPAPSWSGKTTKELNGNLAGMAKIYAAQLTVPYYLQAATPENQSVVKTSYWHGVNGAPLTRGHPSPMKTADVKVPLLISIPNTASTASVMPEEGWPVVIFQHGINGDRSQMLALADSFAAGGMAMVAMDLPLHGITKKDSPFYTDYERTFNVDLDSNQVIDESGAHFINLESLLTSRDNIRQAISDLLVLRRSITQLNPDQSQDVPYKLNPEKVGFVGNSLGGIVGVGYLSVEDKPTPSSIVVAGGGIARLLDASPAFGEGIRVGLAQNGVMANTPDYDRFMAVTQMVIDAADPILLGAKAAAKHPIHFMEIVGDNVVPNVVEKFPLSGTEALIRVMGLKSVYDMTPTPASSGSGAVVRFIAGTHGSLLDSSSNPSVTQEMQRQAVAFQLSQQVTVSDTNVIKMMHQ